MCDYQESNLSEDVRQVLDSTYRVIEHPEQGAMMVRADGENLSMAEIQAAYEAMRNAYHLQQKKLAQRTESEILPDAEWIFPQDWRDLKDSGACVYFAVSTSCPNLIKIGYTTDVFSRRKSLTRKRTGRYTILAYIKTPLCVSLERALHYRFEDAREGRTEFFNAPPVRQFIEQFRGGES